jgi:hypothetical protein
VRYYYETASQGVRVIYTNRRSIQEGRVKGKRKHEGAYDHGSHRAHLQMASGRVAKVQQKEE